MECNFPSESWHSQRRVVDQRAQQTPVRDQGERDTCVGFAVSGAHEWMTGIPGARSPEDAMWAAHTHGGPAHLEATTIAFALAGLTIHKHTSEAAWPYGKPAWPADRPPEGNSSADLWILPIWRELIGADFSSISAELTAGFAVLLSLRVVRRAWRQAGGLVDAPSAQVTRAGHAVLAVGAIDDADGRRVIVKNSWGSEWGVSGYGFLTNRYLEGYLKRAFVLERP